ncbi:Josephin-like protein [Tetrabaena socialis]|uniref:ubiquitinyl hydrolase 1 n=1 Tax=Tetrabaena socialis TaxID=47790 RepID=A0A2J8A2E9_9CHLO|nr:Josephin-like protein [Tetrabaena socialis]|eukprot:PNH06685.1 Josephin-like protein [Tetrabaena socialis]
MAPIDAEEPTVGLPPRRVLLPCSGATPPRKVAVRRTPRCSGPPKRMMMLRGGRPGGPPPFLCHPPRSRTSATTCPDHQGVPMAPPSYHERQSRQLCLKHTLNNLLQRPAFTAADLDRLADGMSPPGPGGIFSPHRTPWLGNYDVNVLELALRQHGKSLTWLSRGSAPALAPRDASQQQQQPPLQDTWLDLLRRDLQPQGEQAQGQQPEGPVQQLTQGPQPAACQPLHQQPPTQRLEPGPDGRPPSAPADAPASSGPDPHPDGGACLAREVDVVLPQPPPDVWALIVNVEHRSWPWLGALARSVGLAAGGRHWLGLRRFDGVW